MKLPDRFYQMVSINIFKIANRTSRILRSKITDTAVPTFASVIITRSGDVIIHSSEYLGLGTMRRGGGGGGGGGGRRGTILD